MTTVKPTKKGATEEVVAEAVLTLEQFVQRSKVNPGTVASFKYEAKKAGDDLKPRTKEAWERAITAQTKRKY